MTHELMRKHDAQIDEKMWENELVLFIILKCRQMWKRIEETTNLCVLD